LVEAELVEAELVEANDLFARIEIGRNADDHSRSGGMDKAENHLCTNSQFAYGKLTLEKRE
jgi:hypothetical protein